MIISNLNRFLRLFLIISISSLSLSGCSIRSSAQKLTQEKQSPSKPGSEIIAVDVAIARLSNLEPIREYIGTTRPVQEVSLRSQVEGRLLKLNVDIGDRLRVGQILAILDDSLLAAAVHEAEAELAARESELARARAQVNNVRQQWERAKIELEQAQNDAQRSKSLLEEGAISRQSEELSQTAAKVAQQAAFSAQEQIKIEQQAVAVALGRVGVQKAVIAQEKQRQAYSRLVSPLNGIVLEKMSEPGDLINPGGEVLRIGDFSKVKVIVPVSDLELAKIRVGQNVKVTLDAFPQQNFTGVVTRISPQSDANTRQIPVEVTIPNPERRIGSLLLARVEFQPHNQSQIIIPESAVRESARQATVFVLKNTPQNNQAIVEAREVVLGDRLLGKVEVIRGLEVGERLVIDSAKPLQDNQPVRLSILSE